MTGRPPSAEPVTRRAAISRARAVRSGRSRPERAARRPAPDCYGAQRGRAAPELRGECSPHSARSWNLGRELRRSVSTRGSREAVSRSGRIQFGCIPVAAGPFTPVRLVNRLLVRCLLIRASDVTVHPYSPYLVSVITHAHDSSWSWSRQVAAAVIARAVHITGSAFRPPLSLHQPQIGYVCIRVRSESTLYRSTVGARTLHR